MNQFDTHEVFNQAPPFGDVNLFACDPALQEALAREGAAWAHADALGAQAGPAEVLDLGAPGQCQRAALVSLRPQRAPHRRSRVPSGLAPADGADDRRRRPCSAVGQRARPGAQVARAAQYLLFGQVENGAQCPVTMTYASVPALRQAGPIAAQMAAQDPVARVRSALAADRAEARRPDRHGHDRKAGRHRRARQHHARHMLDPGRGRARFGAKARAPGASSATSGSSRRRSRTPTWCWRRPTMPAAPACLLLRAALPARRQPQRDPRAAPEGQAGQPLERLVGSRILRRGRLAGGAAGRGIPTILEMGSHTRLDCVVGTAGIMRAALTHALHHARGRAAFGRKLAEQPLMQNVLADLALESEAATVFALRLARCFDHPGDPAQALLGRILTPAGKYWLCKRGPALSAPRRWKSWAATAMSRTARWRACTARRRSIRSGKARAT
jgi:putative acyl-CoA dehydrogenase